MSKISKDESCTLSMAGTGMEFDQYVFPDDCFHFPGSNNMVDMSRHLSSGEQDPSYLNVDRISCLPWEVLNNIFGKLPIVDVIRTSVLAEEWRYKWLSQSNFSFNAFTVVIIPEEDLELEIFELDHRWDVVTSVTNTYLLHHTSSIRSFSLMVGDCDGYYSDMYQWLHYLSKQELEALSIEVVSDCFFKMPSHIFSFERLESLHLRKCAFQIPSTFGGFRLLNKLYLREVSICDADLLHLILSCPLLEYLTLLSMPVLKHLRINAPRLSRLLIDTSYEDIVIEAAPNLSSVRIAHFSRNEDEPNVNLQSVIHCLSGIGSLNHLGLSGYFIKLLSADDGLKNLPLSNDAVTSLNLHNLRFDDIEGFRVCLSLLRSCCNIKYFSILIGSFSGAKLTKKFYKENRGQFSFTKLEAITVVWPSYAGMGYAVNLIQFIISHSPNLKFLTIQKEGKVGLNTRQVTNMVSRFRKSCPHASVFYEHFEQPNRSGVH